MSSGASVSASGFISVPLLSGAAGCSGLLTVLTTSDSQAGVQGLASALGAVHPSMVVHAQLTKWFVRNSHSMEELT